MENITNLTEENVEQEMDYGTEGEIEMEEMVITFEEEVEAKEAGKVKQFVTNDKVQVAAASTAIAGIIGFLAGKTHEMKVQKELLGRVTEIIDLSYNAIMQTIDNEENVLHKQVNELVNGNSTEDAIELQEAATSLQQASGIIIKELEDLTSISKFNFIAKRRAKQWITVNEKLIALITAIKYQEASYQKIIAGQQK